MKRGALLDLILLNKEGLTGVVKVKGTLGYSDHEMVEFRVLRGGSRMKSEVITLDFRRPDFRLFKNLLVRVPCDTTLEGKGPKKAGEYLRIATSNLKSSPS